MDQQTVMAIFKAHHVRPTQQRIVIYTYIVEHPSHPTADTIFQAVQSIMPACSLMTVYNVLDTLVDAGLLQVITIDAGHKRFDATMTFHGHFQCKRCGLVYDFPYTVKNIQNISLDGFQIQEQQYYCSGICRNCLENI